MTVLDPNDLPDDAVMLVANALAMDGMPPPMPGCEHRDCQFCGRPTWAAPSTLAAEGVREVCYACLSCALLLNQVVGGLGEPRRLRGADNDVDAPGSLVTRESEEAAARLFEGR